MPIQKNAISGSPIQAAPGGRLSFDQTNVNSVAVKVDQTVLYYLPLNGGLIPLWTGANWVLWQLPDAGLSLNLAALAVGTYEIFINWGNGVPFLLAVAWTSNTARSASSAIVNKNGFVVRFDSSSALSLGCIYIETLGKCNLTRDKVHLSNRYNRIVAPLNVTCQTDSWQATGQYINEPFGNRPGNSTIGLTSRVSVLNCDDSALTDLSFTGFVDALNVNPTILIAGGISMGLDSLNTRSTFSSLGYFSGKGALFPVPAVFKGPASTGLHFMQVLQQSYELQNATFLSNTSSSINGWHTF